MTIFTLTLDHFFALNFNSHTQRTERKYANLPSELIFKIHTKTPVAVSSEDQPIFVILLPHLCCCRIFFLSSSQTQLLVAQTEMNTHSLFTSFAVSTPPPRHHADALLIIFHTHIMLIFKHHPHCWHNESQDSLWFGVGKEAGHTWKVVEI